MTSPPEETPPRRPVSADTLALIIAAVIAVAVVAGLVPTVAW